MNTLKDNKIKDALRCPVCGCGMNVENKGCGVLFCEGERRHSYDLASSGYVNLSSPGQSNGGDSKSAVRARSAFLDTGHYRPIADRLGELIEAHCKPQGLVVDAGCGEGYYSVSIAERGFRVAGFDLSKPAADAAAKRARRQGTDNAFFGVASVYAMPLAEGSADAVVNVFAPCAEDEYSRVLNDNGKLIVVYAGPEHLLGLKTAIYRQTHMNEERADLPRNMREIQRERMKYSITVDGNDTVKALFAMTPYYWKTSRDDVSKLDSIETLTTDIDIIFAVYGK